MLHFYIFSKNSEKYNKELLFGLWIPFIHYLLRELRPLLVLFLSTYTFEKSIVDINSEPYLYYQII